ncbi:FAD/NAD(P)-binding protein [Acuticoccus mangrovi]|uniref:FAD/NAD(P)-binding protein n=1 Tax=Acuticoccus mangrovi TaxID=2796142 RepID=A0A934IIV2_9HYPH|nr:FAD/NAD(P)-binding protein [Acuticoccus mangrovi]MBJ3777499.1 FAD/NAD(P)-binding protein [Acuticoccus mangrovi]
MIEQGGQDLLVDVAVIGGGPRGIATVERLSARWVGGSKLRVAVIDAVEVGAGSTWTTDQTPIFLANTRADQTTIYPDGSTEIDGPLVGGPTFLEWAQHVSRQPDGHEGWVAAECDDVHAWTFASRRLHGVYYHEQFARIASRPSLDVVEVRGQATDLERDGSLRRITLADGGTVTASAVVLAQGMIATSPGGDTDRFIAAAAADGLIYVPPGMPAVQDWNRVEAGEPALVRGLGACFFDILAALTLGRGGRLTGVGLDAVYEPSGAEPILIAGSGRGLPFRGKARYPDGVPTRYVPRFLGDEVVRGLITAAPVNFEQAVEPLAVRELVWAYLDALCMARPDVVAEAGAWEPALLRLKTAEDVDALMALAVAEPRHRLRLSELASPTPPATLSRADWDAYVDGYLRDDLSSVADPTTSPIDAVNRAMQFVRTQMNKLNRAGAFDGSAYISPAKRALNRNSAYIASGPPPERMELMWGLRQAGLLQFVGAASRFDHRDHAFVAWSPRVTGEPIRAKTLVEAWVPRGRISHTADPLLRSLLDRGRASLFGVTQASGERVLLDSLNVTGDRFSLVDAHDVADDRVYAIGIPAGDVQPGSAIGATPGVFSPLLAGADRVAAAILTILQETTTVKANFVRSPGGDARSDIDDITAPQDVRPGAAR